MTPRSAGIRPTGSPLNHAPRVLVYFEGAAPDTVMEYLGPIQVSGDDPSVDLLNRFKYKAWQYGANAVIETKKDSRFLQSSTVFANEPGDYYSATIYRGIAVKIHDLGALSRLEQDMLGTPDRAMQKFARRRAHKTWIERALTSISTVSLWP